MQIEIIGPSGAGKSTIHRRLLERNPNLFGGMSDVANLKRALDPKLSKPCSLLPGMVERRILNQLWHRYYKQQYINACYATNPEILNGISAAISATTDYESRMMTFFTTTVSEYQFTKEHCQSNEDSLFDEGFLQRAITTTAYSYDLPPEAYLRQVPYPDIIIHVDAPTDVCIQRMESRDREMRDYDIPTVEAISKLRETADFVTNQNGGREISIVYVENTAKLECVLEKVEDTLHRLSSS